MHDPNKESYDNLNFWLLANKNPTPAPAHYHLTHTSDTTF